jgi:hypothetical protein
VVLFDGVSGTLARGPADGGLRTPLGDATSWMGLDPTPTEGYANLRGYPAVYGRRLTNDVA